MIFTAWKAYMTLEEREKNRCDRHAAHALLKSMLKKWIYEVKVRWTFMNAMKRIRTNKVRRDEKTKSY